MCFSILFLLLLCVLFLGPAHFLLCINDPLNVICNITNYADDTTFLSIRDWASDV